MGTARVCACVCRVRAVWVCRANMVHAQRCVCGRAAHHRKSRTAGKSMQMVSSEEVRENGNGNRSSIRGAAREGRRPGRKNQPGTQDWSSRDWAGTCCGATASYPR
eukprot:472123-Prymnesium_polylepis.1